MFTPQQLWRIGCVLGASGVAFGAFGAHGLRHYIEDQRQIENWKTASFYLLHHVVILQLVLC
jgi:uncharacterized membrane protein YgdD (TMEM256/DUF423 family)